MAETESGDAAKRPAFRQLPPLIAELDAKEPWSRARLVHGRVSRANRTRRSIGIVVALSIGLVMVGWPFSLTVPWLRREPHLYWSMAVPAAVVACVLAWAWFSGRVRAVFPGRRESHTRDHRWPRPFDQRGPGRRMLLASLPFLWFLWQVPNFFLNSEIRQYPTIRALLILALAPFLAWALYRLHGLFWTGTVRVRFEPFPMCPGSTATITVGLAERATPPDAMALRLVAYRERPNSYWKLPVDVFLQSDTRVVVDDPVRLPAAGSDVEIEIPVPDGPTTRLAASYPTYWELELHVVTRDGDYVERFLAPVYEAEARGVDAPDATLDST